MQGKICGVFCGKLQVGSTTSGILSENVQPILLYDGVCGLCNRLVQFILRRDRDDVFRFAALQSHFAAKILSGHGVNPAALDTFYIVLNHAAANHAVLNDASRHDHPPGDDPTAEAPPAESLLSRSEAMTFILSQFGGFWRFTGSVFAAQPRPVRDWIYCLVARNRYRVFGRYDTCPAPNPATKARFLEL